VLYCSEEKKTSPQNNKKTNPQLIEPSLPTLYMVIYFHFALSLLSLLLVQKMLYAKSSKCLIIAMHGII